MYGRATYMAKDTVYSDQGYAYQLPSGERQLLLVEAALGRIDERPASDRTIRLPKPGCHTVAGPVGGGFRAYMKYESYHVYPSHLITYKP
jgi:hypothetical protein